MNAIARKFDWLLESIVYGPIYSTVMETAEAAGFRIPHQSIHDYRPTLRAWFDNVAQPLFTTVSSLHPVRGCSYT